MKRRNLLAAAALGGVSAVVAANSAFAAAVATARPPGAPGAPGAVAGGTAAGIAAATADSTVEPAGGAGLFDVDPVQGSLSQAPGSVATGDVAVLSEDWGF